MKKKALFTIILSAVLMNFGVKAQVVDSMQMALTQNWEFAQSPDGEWLSATVPGTVHQDLLNHGLLPDLFYGTNEAKIQWVEKKDWDYRTSFEVTASQLAKDGAVLAFEGLDTYADVYLNGVRILQSENMFVGHRLQVKEHLKIGKNLLVVHFRSPIAQALPQWESNGFNYPADNDHSAKRTSVFTRKAPYSYGWDWGIRVATSGIWRPVTLSFFDLATIEDYHVNQLSLTDAQAKLQNRIELNSVATSVRQVTVEFICSLKGKTVYTKETTATLHPGKNVIGDECVIGHPQRWMPHGWGEATLYDCTVNVKDADGRVIASKSRRVGLRTLCVVNEKDVHGESFYIEVNGKPLFAKGANYIPSDALLPNVTHERYRQMFADVKAANMNMLRVWGGGIYENDEFYDLADENGILIWQDFMFACTVYPGDAQFLANVRAEAEYNIKRLRNHPSLALWCGNNEAFEGTKFWGWKKKYGEKQFGKMLADYDKLFRELLPSVVKELDGRFYVHTSPYEANWGRPATWGYGDSHNWGVWYGRKPFESLDTEIPRFMSEFGFQSFPEMKTVAKFAAPQDWQIESEVMNAHQKSTIGNHLIKTYMERDYRVPATFEDFVYVGSVLQGEGIGRGLLAHRRNRPYCMGTLVWQLNDSWPVVSWSSIDYYGNWKALQYRMRDNFKPLAIDAWQHGDSLELYLLSDLLETQKGMTLKLEVKDFNGKQVPSIGSAEYDDLPAEANSSKKIMELTVSHFGDSTALRSRYLLLTLSDKTGKVMDRRIHYFDRVKKLNLQDPKVKCSSKQEDGKMTVVLTAASLAKDVFVEIPVQGARFSDNFFDMQAGEKKTIVITSPEIKKNEKIEIKINHIQKTYKTE